MDRYFGSASGSSPDPLTRTRRRLTASPPSAFLAPAFNACASATSDVDPALLRLSRQSSAAAACRFLRSSPLSPILNVKPVAIEEEVLVMDEVLVSESRKANFTWRNNSAGGACKMELCRSWEEVGVCRYGSKCQFAHGKEELLWEPRGARPCKQKSERFGNKGNKYVPSPGSISYNKKSYRYISLPGPNTPHPSLASTPEKITPTVKPPSSTFNWPPTEEEDDLIMHVLYGPTTRLRLPVFEQICPQ